MSNVNHPSFREKSSFSPVPLQSSTVDGSSLVGTWGVAMASASVVAAAWASRWLAAVAADLGQASEEVFRGDRLPLLKTPVPPSDSAPGHSSPASATNTVTDTATDTAAESHR